MGFLYNLRFLFFSADYPDLSKHHNIMSNHLTPGVYASLRDKMTPNGITLDQCIQTGVDNIGHPFIKIVGLVAGDEESYEVRFAKINLWMYNTADIYPNLKHAI